MSAEQFVTSAEDAAKRKASRSFKKFSFRGIELSQLLDLKTEELVSSLHARARRRLTRGLNRKPAAFLKKCRNAKKTAPVNEKPALVKTHLRNMLVLPEMIGSMVGVYNGKTFNTIEIKPEMTGFYLGEFSSTYKPVQHKTASGKGKFGPLK